jgi:hypothetical protein
VHPPGHKPVPIGLQDFCRGTWPDVFHREFLHQEIHEKAPTTFDLKRIARAVCVGGLHAIVLEPGKGKTTLAIATAIWATHEGLRRFPVVLVPTEKDVEAAKALATKLLERDPPHRYVSFDPATQIRFGPVEGMKRDLPRAKVELPDLAIIDDPEPDGATEEQQKLTDAVLAKAALLGNGLHVACVVLGSLALCQRLKDKGWRVE